MAEVGAARVRDARPAAEKTPKFVYPFMEKIGILPLSNGSENGSSASHHGLWTG
jgi:hypothetical protein